jgi:hypothetical protein
MLTVKVWCESFLRIIFHAIGFFNEADTLESSTILIYSKFQMGLYTQIDWREAAVIKMIIKRCVNEDGIKKG